MTAVSRITRLARLRHGDEELRRAEVERAEVARVLAMAVHPARGQA